jgi:hypothetical protein
MSNFSAARSTGLDINSPNTPLPSNSSRWYPRINSPYAWPDVNSSPSVAEADLEAIVGVIETYRFSQGQYPTTLSQVRFPDGLAKMVEGSKLDYSPSEKGYALAWALPNWLASYTSETGKINVEPKGKR